MLRKICIGICVLMAPSFAHAHVGYVLSENDFATHAGIRLSAFFNVFTNPVYVFLMFLTGVLLCFFAWVIHRFNLLHKLRSNLEKKKEEYQAYFPWIIRLSIGVALIGAGSAHVLINPLIADGAAFSTIQILLGFMVLAGFLLEFVVWAVLLLFTYALAGDFYLLGNLDYAALLISFLLIGDTRPGVDDLLEIPCACLLDGARKYLPLILRIGIGVSMIFLALYEKLLNPGTSGLVVELYGLQHVIPVSIDMWVVATGIIELCIGIGLLIGFYTRTIAAVASIVLTLSFFYFGEDVYSHITLFGTLSILFVTGGGFLSFDTWWSRKSVK